MKILITGDICPQEAMLKKIKNNGDAFWGDFRNIISNVDYSITNLECPVVKDEALPLNKYGPNLKCLEKAIEAIKFAGFNCVTLANNHFYDYGDDGVNDTLGTCQDYEIDTVGGGVNIKSANRTLYKRINDKTLAVINCCEHEFSIATEHRGGANPLNPIKQYYTIQEARKFADYVVVIVHGGHEHYQFPSPRMQETYRFFIDAGADAVINHHQHCFSGYESYRDKIIIYGLGNFLFESLFSQRKSWHEGYFVVLEFEDNINFEIHPYMQCASNNMGIELLPSDSFNKRIQEMNAIIADPSKLEDMANRYYAECEGAINCFLEPMLNRLYLALRNRKLLPSFISKKRKLIAEDFVCCESHRDKLMWYLTKQER